MHIQKPWGEVVESSLEMCTVETWMWDTPIPIGTLVYIPQQRIQTDNIPLVTWWGVLNSITTTMRDGSTPVAYQRDYALLKRDMPHIFAGLVTRVRISICGYSYDDQTFYYHQPPAPPLPHVQAHCAQSDNYRLWYNNPTACDLIMHSAPTPQAATHLLIAALKHALCSDVPADSIQTILAHIYRQRYIDETQLCFVAEHLAPWCSIQTHTQRQVLRV